jgi:hypothetical protein
LKLGKLPSVLKSPRKWRTRPDPFEEEWPEIVQRLRDAPELEAKALFEDLLERYPDRYHPGHLRTFQRRIKQWRASQGPERSVFFPQEHSPGEAFQTDFTWATKLGVTIGGEPFAHMLCHLVLPYSNWEWVTVCRSESLVALKRGIYKGVANKHLQRYLDEFCYRFDRRFREDRLFDRLLCTCLSTTTITSSELRE